MKNLRTRRVGVLMGGLSAEREVSLSTGGAALKALKRRGYRAVPVDVGRDIAAVLRRRRIEVAFIALHGRGGEDGTIQGLLESMGIPYTGSGVLGSAVAMDKKLSKWVFASQRLRTPEFAVLKEPELPSRGWPWRSLRPPVVVKPTREGSTIGIGLVRKAGELRPALKKAFRHGEEVMVERYVPGRELTVGVLGEKALPVIEIKPQGGFYDYRAKYGSSTTRYLVPAPLRAAAVRRLQDTAVKAQAVLGCSGATRVDFRLDPRGRAWLLEVNTIPGMTESSLLPKAAQEAGMGFDDLVEWILKEAVKR